MEKTKYFDDNKDPIFVGDRLRSEWDYAVFVVKDGKDYQMEIVSVEAM